MSKGKLPHPWLPIAILALVAAGVLGGAGGASIGPENATPEVLWALLLFGMIALILALLNMGPDTSEPVGAEAWLCKHCLKPYVPGAHFCPHCAAPQTFFACTGQYERIYAMAWCLGKAAHHPSRPLHVWGLAALGGLPLLALVVGLVLLSFDTRTGFMLSLFSMGWSVSHNVLTAALFLRCLTNYLRRDDSEEEGQSAIEYGSPPWWTYDSEWALPEFVDEDDAKSVPMMPGPKGPVTPR